MRTNSICCVTIALYSDNQEEPEYEGVYIEADTPEEAYQHAKKNVRTDMFFPEYTCDEVEVDSYEAYCTEAYDFMDKIYLQDGRVLSYKDYIEETTWLELLLAT